MTIIQDRIFPIPTDPSWETLDASKLNCFMKCPRKYFYRYLLGWTPEGENHNLVFGSAWHDAMEQLLIHGYNKTGIEAGFAAFEAEYRKHYSPQTDLDFHPKSPGNALLALAEYAEKWKHDNFKVLYTEVGSELPFDDEGTKITFRLDAIIDRSGRIGALEHKTSKYNAGWWIDQWSLALQPNLYTHALFCLYSIEQIFGVEINGTFFYKTTDAKKRSGQNDFIRVPVRKTLGQMNNWYTETLRWIQSLKNEFSMLSIETPEMGNMASFPKNPNSCIDYMRTCEYHPFCTSWENPLQHAERAPIGFKVERWDPLAKKSKFVLSGKEIKEAENGSADNQAA